MRFQYSYRDEGGILKYGSLEADNRAELHSVLRQQGVHPISVEACPQGVTGNWRVRETGRSITFVKAIAAAGIISALIGGMLWLFSRQGKNAEVETDATARPKGMVKEVAPAVMHRAARAVAPSASTISKEEKDKAMLAQIRAKYGDNVPSNLQAVVYFLENPPQRTFTPARTKASIFRHHSERMIASVLTTEPGSWFMQRPTIGRGFDHDFAASLGDEIVINDDDSAEDKELKRAVIETKAELAERVKKGEKASDIVDAHLQSLYELGQYKENLRVELSRIKKDASYNDQDIRDFVSAANELLKDKGLAPFKMPNLVIRNISLKMAAKKAAAEQINKEQKK